MHALSLALFQLSAMQAELASIIKNDENKLLHLHGMLTQVTSSYQALKMHLVELMQSLMPACL
jgi:hypothetical protein